MKKIFTKHEQINGDTITPIRCFLNLRNAFTGVSLFESSDYSSRDKSKSFICAEPLISLTASGNKFTIRTKECREQKSGDSLLKMLDTVMKSYTFEKSELHDLNGFFGVFSYDSVAEMETVTFKPKTRFTELPEVYLSAYRYIVVFDNFTNKVDLIMNSSDTNFDGFSFFKQVIYQSKIYHSRFQVSGKEMSNESDTSFIEKIKRGKVAVDRGEVFQLVLSRAFSRNFSGDDFEVYRRLRTLNPSPYMFYFDLEKAQLLGASPEAQLRITNSIAEIHPIAGTVKRSGNEFEDAEKAKALLINEKENAEHTMLVDLARNDLNRACADVDVKRYKDIQQFSHVIHMVSKVTGTLKAKGVLDTFGATFPAGTLSGAPKYRAMELINETETDNRGFYGGAIGQITPNGNLNMAIIIRSALSYKNTLHYQAGAGIVLDSIPESELQEVEHKTGAIRQAITLASTIKNN